MACICSDTFSLSRGIEKLRLIPIVKLVDRSKLYISRLSDLFNVDILKVDKSPPITGAIRNAINGFFFSYTISISLFL